MGQSIRPSLQVNSLNMDQLIYLLCLAGTSMALYTNKDTAAVYAQPEFRLNQDQVEDRIRDFFSLEDVGQTALGRILAWKGDIIQPAALFGLGIFAVYTLFRIVITLLSGVIDVKTGLLGRFFGALNDLNEAFLDKLAGTSDDTPEGRQKRDLLDLAETVYKAITKYE